MTPALIASLVTSIVALISGLGLWIKSRANMNNEFAKIIADRASTKEARDRKSDNQDIEIAKIKKDLEHEKELSARLERDLENNTNGLKEDISDLKAETNSKLNQLDIKLTKYQDDTNSQFKDMMKQMSDAFKENAIQIATLQGSITSLQGSILNDKK